MFEDTGLSNLHIHPPLSMQDAFLKNWLTVNMRGGILVVQFEAQHKKNTHMRLCISISTTFSIAPLFGNIPKESLPLTK